MNDNNDFLSSYKKTANQPEEQNAEAPTDREAPPSLRYEEKSGFVKPQHRGGSNTPPSRDRQRLILPIIISALVVIGIIAGLTWVFGQGVEVINLSNWTINDAQLWANDNGVKLQIEEQYNDQFDADKVFAQSPEQGKSVSKGGFVKVSVSLGHDLSVTLPLPDIKSMTKEEIEAWAATNYMTKVRITTEFSNDIESGKVISYEVNDNTVVDEVKRNTPIYVVVSKGKEDDTAVLITVPNFREKSVSESYIFANENGLVLTMNEQYDDYAPKGAITAQSVKADVKVKKGDEIILTISKGKKITVPDFSDYTKQKATAVAAEIGIPVTFIEKYSSLKTGEFVSQSIPADSIYEDGDVLELSYSLGNKIVISDFVGQTRDAIETWAQGLNDQGASISMSVSTTQSNAPKGKIIYQDKSNTLISIKTTIKITVSLGKAVFVPDFIAPAGSGYDEAITREEALTMCEALNIIPIFVQAASANRLPGEIWYQSLPAGKEITEGTTITLKYTPANVNITVPNFDGMTEADIIAGDYYRTLDIIFVKGSEVVDGYANKVYNQSLRAGSTAVSGSVITLTVSPAP